MNDKALILEAAFYAAKMHRDQRRKGASGAPYINHVLEVARDVAAAGGDTPTIMAALLHDTVEDTDAEETDLRDLFGAEVTDLVMEVTDDKSLDKADRKRLQVEHASHKTARARMIKLADKTANLRDLIYDAPPDWPADRQREYFEWAKRVVDGLRGDHPALEAEFDDVYERGIETY